MFGNKFTTILIYAVTRDTHTEQVQIMVISFKKKKKKKKKKGIVSDNLNCFLLFF